MAVVTVTLNPCIDKSFRVARMVSDHKLSAEDVRDDPGGGGINVARVVHRLGGDVTALWSCGGEVGRRLAALLDAEQVPHRPVPIADSVRENLIVTDASTGEQYRFGMPGPAFTAQDQEGWLSQLRAVPAATRYVVLSGSPAANVSADAYRALLQALPRGPRLIVDTKKAALRWALASGVFLIKPNAGELQDITGHALTDDAQMAEAARGLVTGRGKGGVLVSLGRGGALLVTADRTLRLSSPSVPIRSKVGAGDSMVGGLVAALDQGRSVDDAARLAVAAGAAAVMSEGTELCRREDAERLYHSVYCHEIP